MVSASPETIWLARRVIVRKACMAAMAAPSDRRGTTASNSTVASGRAPLRGPVAHGGAEEHHPLHAEIEHSGALGQQLAERREEQRRPVLHCLGEHDDERLWLMFIAPAPAGGLRAVRGLVEAQPVAEKELTTERAEEDDALHDADEPGREIGPLEREAAVLQPAEQHRHDAYREWVVAGERGDDDSRVAEGGGLKAVRAAVERVREVADLARAAETSDGARYPSPQGSCDAYACPRSGRRAASRPSRSTSKPSACASTEPTAARGGQTDQEAERDDETSRTVASWKRRASACPAGRTGLERGDVAPVRRAVEDQVREQETGHVVEHQRSDDLVRAREGPQHARDQRPERADAAAATHIASTKSGVESTP